MGTSADQYTVVKNTSGATKFFGFLGRHGRSLANAATFNIPGPPQSQFGWNARKQASFEAALIAGTVTIVSTPAIVLNDTTPDAALVDPTTVLTVNPTGGGASGGVVAAGHYRFSYTAYNIWGQTLAGGESADVTVAATNIPRVTFPAIPGGTTGYKLYMSDVSVGAVSAGATKKYFNKITSGTTLDLNSASWNEGTQSFANAPAVPTANLTAGHAPRTLRLANEILTLSDPSWYVNTAVPGAGFSS